MGGGTCPSTPLEISSFFSMSSCRLCFMTMESQLLQQCTWSNIEIEWSPLFLVRLHSEGVRSQPFISKFLLWSNKIWYDADVAVSMSAFLTCHQCYCLGSSLTWGLNLRALVCGISEAHRQGFSLGTSVSSPSSSV